MVNVWGASCTIWHGTFDGRVQRGWVACDKTYKNCLLPIGTKSFLPLESNRMDSLGKNNATLEKDARSV